jgi:hypothetical protein
VRVADQGSVGGAANERGSQFRGRVAAWFAAHGLAGIEPPSLDLPPESGAQPREVMSIRLEADAAVDDIEVMLADDVRLLVQAKRTVSRSSSPQSAFVKTVHQWGAAVSRGEVRSGRDRLLLVTEEPSGPIRALGQALRRRRAELPSLMTGEEAAALSALEQRLGNLTGQQRELLLDCAAVVTLRLSEDGVGDAGVAAVLLDDRIVAAGWGVSAFRCLAEQARELAADRQGRFLRSWLAALQADGLPVIAPVQPEPSTTSGRLLVPAPPPPAEEQLARLLSHSRRAVQDAALVRPARSPQVDTADGEHLAELRLEALYVPRLAAEAKVHASVRAAASGRIVLVLGDAGHGKTSLLWRVHGLFAGEETIQPLFLKATYLAQAPSGQPSLGPPVTRPGLVQAVQALRRRGICPLVLLDTIDVLLHEERQEDEVLALLGDLRDSCCVVVVASRPTEAAVVAPMVGEGDRVRLGRYTQAELRSAVVGHSRRFYRQAVGRDPDEEAARILRAVSQGRPLREVCLGPLTLRMLFDLYAPHEIETEVHVAQLYQQFWDHRVRQDRRSGRDSSGAGTRDLTRLAAAIAVVMLAEGQPELPVRRLEAGLAQLGIEQQDMASGLRELTDRGVLVASSDRYQFFHQTFFEHAAARALTAGGRAGLAQLLARQQQTPGDPFLAPVVEHGLLLALTPDMLTPVFQFAENELVTMLQTAADGPRHSAMYVYAHAAQVGPRVRDTVRAVLARGDAATADVFLRGAVNVPEDRLDDLFTDLDVVWTNGRWRERQHVIELLERLSARDPQHVAEFLNRHRVLDVVLTTEGAIPATARVLVRTFAGTARSAPAISFAWLTRLLDAEPAKPQGRPPQQPPPPDGRPGRRRPVAGREVYASMLTTLAEPTVANAFGAGSLATRLIPVLTRRLAPVREGERVFRAYGAVWAQEWRARSLNVSAILASLDHQHPVVESAQYYALAEVLASASKEEARRALQTFLDEPLERRYQWVSVVIPGLFRRWINQPASQAASDPPPLASPQAAGEAIEAGEPAGWRPPIIDELVRWIAAQLARPLPDRSGTGRRWRADEGVLARKALENSRASGPLLQRILATAGQIDREAWLDADRLAGVLASAALVGHPTAVDALQHAQRHPAELADPAAYRVLSALQDFLTGEPSALAAAAAEAFLDLCLGTDDLKRVTDLLPSIAKTAPAVARRRADELNDAAQRLLASRSALTRRGAARLWLTLTQQRLIPAPPLALVRRQVEVEPDMATAAVLLHLVATARIADNPELQSARELLTGAARDATTAARSLRPGAGTAERQGTAVGQVYRRDQALLALTELLAVHVDKVGVTAVIEAATRHPIAVDRVDASSRLAERLAVDGRATESLQIIRAWGQVAGQPSGQKLRKNIAAHLRSALAALFQHAPTDVRDDLLYSLPSFEEHFARAVVDAACREQFLASLPILVGLLEARSGTDQSTQELPSRVRRVILGYRHERERTRGNAGWPELLDSFRL